MRDVAAELLDVYAMRAARHGFAFKHDREAYRQFAAGFPFEETDDQLNAINAVLGDMCQAKSMDRLVCGDVGFGKTEVAMRAAFVAVHGGKQVAVLVPTTLLAQQHYDNFRDRFANWPVRVEVLSRFRSAKEQTAVMKELAEGKVDIIIGTHKLLGAELTFRIWGCSSSTRSIASGCARRKDQGAAGRRGHPHPHRHPPFHAPSTWRCRACGISPSLPPRPPSASPSRPSCASRSRRSPARQCCGN